MTNLSENTEIYLLLCAICSLGSLLLSIFWTAIEYSTSIKNRRAAAILFLTSPLWGWFTWIYYVGFGVRVLASIPFTWAKLVIEAIRELLK